MTLSTGEAREYDNLVVANGHHLHARTPTYPGTFDGYQVHSHHYRDPFEPYDFRGKRVLVVVRATRRWTSPPSCRSDRSPSR